MLGTLAARLYGEPGRRADADGGHRHPGQDHHHPAARGRPDRGRGDGRRRSAPSAPASPAATSKTALTTPEAPDLHALFAVMVEQGVSACAMEVSSHALVMGRVAGVVFDVAAFLNLGRDHLDFHADVEDYFAAKASLFTPSAPAGG